ncbi:hypothetical protein NEUTE1DRAFT_108031 [Neurospora tetrasperma FGSC 2508]|uniref:Uncharacterized protein n=1 Tax=Neurospora tetrasperma (strain FGSC 2508 / ATCC MYA-4615 / P0657) TaxID=510951 RepID=F8ME43_NEUT8|nr:uncharacterized protein NEUTE1DRAFT_108031 [Neurospora tetrasperma FGSC 2508]EGO61578.1 hypothetical protein NEUTE1DRAFT_108031 [Neurospora tetrasperma FGSC 2508]EGZ74378.1 hypothetical protein NEUTE2DRAFT_58862 [Neurospora tetrasperma FGSC 2509]
MCTVTYNEIKCSLCKTLIKSEVDRSKCYEVWNSEFTMNPLDFGGCKEGQTSVTKTKEEGMCDGCWLCGDVGGGSWNEGDGFWLRGLDCRGIFYKTHRAPLPIPIPNIVPPPSKMCTITFNETYCSHCKNLVQSDIDRNTCYEVLKAEHTAKPLAFGGCKDGQTTETTTKEVDMCGDCKAKDRGANVWKGSSMGAPPDMPQW